MGLKGKVDGAAVCQDLSVNGAAVRLLAGLLGGSPRDFTGSVEPALRLSGEG